MVAVACDSSESNCRFVLRPNRSLSWRGTVIFFSSVFAVYLAITLPLAAMGLWLVLPFAGLELLVLGICLYITSQKSSQCEVISVGGETIKIESGRRRPERCSEFDRHWARVELVRSPLRWHPSRLTIRSHGRQVEVGSFLSETEREDLARELRRAIAPA